MEQQSHLSCIVNRSDLPPGADDADAWLSR